MLLLLFVVDSEGVVVFKRVVEEEAEFVDVGVLLVADVPVVRVQLIVKQGPIQ